MSEQRVLRVAGKAVIETEDSILIVHPSKIDINRNWHIPGGIRDDINEPIAETAVREVLEETCIDLSGLTGSVFKVGEWLGIDQGEKVKILAIFFHFVLPKKPAIKLSHEHDDFAWINRSNYKEIELIKKCTKLLRNCWDKFLDARSNFVVVLTLTYNLS